MAQQHLAAVAFDGAAEAFTETLHGTLQVPEPQGGLTHLQHRGAIQRCRALTGLLGIEAQLQVEKAAQPLVAAATRQAQEIPHRQQTERGADQIAQAQRRERSTEIPAAANRKDRISGGELPVLLMNPAAKLPKPFRARELRLTLLMPALRVVPEVDGR